MKCKIRMFECLPIAFLFILASCGKPPSVAEGVSAYAANDYAAAIKILTPLAEGGNLEAQINLGQIYMPNELDPEKPSDDKKSFMWYSKAANQGDENSQFHLGFLYEEGQGVTQNKEQAFYYWEKSAKNGSWDKQNFVAKKYYEAKRYKEAAKWHLLLAEQGDDESQSMICGMYLEGLGVRQDFQEAYRWCTKAAEKDDSWALHTLGNIYEKGLGTQADLVRAHMYYNLSRDNVFSKMLITDLEKLMTKSQIIDAQILAKSWVDSKKKR